VLITFLIGCIIAQQGILPFPPLRRRGLRRRPGRHPVLREIGVLIVAIMVAGRSGQFLHRRTRLDEDARGDRRAAHHGLRSGRGAGPAAHLALVVALPILTFIGSMAALYGGGLVAWLYGGMSPDDLHRPAARGDLADHFKVGMIKAPFMALVIGIVACARAARSRAAPSRSACRPPPRW
jgi:phospholipid/cholesterol/gamma-HCH transport system permease protein